MSPKERGERAKALLNDEVLQSAMNSVRERLITQLENSAFGDAETHHQAAISLQLLKSLRLTLLKYVDAGDAQAVIERDEKARKNMRQSIKRP